MNEWITRLIKELIAAAALLKKPHILFLNSLKEMALHLLHSGTCHRCSLQGTPSMVPHVVVLPEPSLFACFSLQEMTNIVVLVPCHCCNVRLQWPSAHTWPTNKLLLSRFYPIALFWNCLNSGLGSSVRSKCLFSFGRSETCVYNQWCARHVFIHVLFIAFLKHFFFFSYRVSAKLPPTWIWRGGQSAADSSPSLQCLTDRPILSGF